jgi:hypothetical protein
LVPSRFRILLLLAALVSLAAAFTACGGDDDEAGDENPQQVLDRTFSSDNDLESADIDASLVIDVAGAGGDPFTANLTGPIDARGEGTPSFDLTVDLSGGGGADRIDFEGGAISTGDAGYISYEGTDYELDSQTFGFVEQIIQSASLQQDDEQADDVPGIRSFLTDVTNEGTEDVEGTETVHVSGAVDIEKLIDTLRPFAERAGQLGLGATSQVPSPAELDQLNEQVQSATFDVYSGTDDDLLRRLVIDLRLQEVGGEGTGTISLDITLSGVNEAHEVEAPSDAEPLADLLSALNVDLGGLGALGGLGGGAGAGAGGGPPPGQSSGSIDCLQQAETTADVQACVQ